MAFPKPENQRYAVTFRLHNKQTSKEKNENKKQNKTKQNKSTIYLHGKQF